MIHVAHVLEEVEPGRYGVGERNLKIVKQTLEGAGYRVRIHGIEHCVPDRVEFYQTQSNKRYPFRAAYADRVLSRLWGMPEDIIILTEEWHRECFKGLIVNGFWRDLPVVELRGWKDQPAQTVARKVTRMITELPECPKSSASRIPSVQGTLSS